jgi:putative RNA 2'-phosphotransferase
MAVLPAERISRFLTYLLRHRPEEYPLVFDEQGYVDWRDVVELVQERFYDVTEEHIKGVITDAEKKRFELHVDKVRATYGHSFPIDLGMVVTEPPSMLYYGTARNLAQSILRDGLKPSGRQYVHLSVSADEAEKVTRRHDPSPAIVIVDATAAHADGVCFYHSGPLFLVESVAAKFLSLR